MNRDFFLEFLGFIFFKLWRVFEFSLTFTAAVSAVAVFQRVHYTKIGDAGGVPLQPV